MIGRNVSFLAALLAAAAPLSAASPQVTTQWVGAWGYAVSPLPPGAPPIALSAGPLVPLAAPPAASPAPPAIPLLDNPGRLPVDTTSAELAVLRDAISSSSMAPQDERVS